MSRGQAFGLVLVALAIAGTFVLRPGGGGDEPEPTGPTRGCDAAREPDERATLCLLNAERRARGRDPLRRHARLDAAAAAHARDMAARDFFAHDTPEGTDPHERIRAAGYRRATATGENLAKGERSAGAASSIVDGWMHSPGHRANILRRRFEEIGVAIVEDGDLRIYVTTFGAR